jgi:hypothetical protein
MDMNEIGLDCVDWIHTIRLGTEDEIISIR